MKNKRSINRTAGTVISALVVTGMLILCLCLSDFSFTEDQFSALKILAAVCGGSVLYCFIAGEASGNFSQMDKLWSLLPIVYLWIIAVKGGLNARLLIYALIVTVWGIRLTVNFARKGAYNLKFWTGVEDYRWSIVRNFPVFRNRFAWAAFDLFFISIYQNFLVLAICLPALAVLGSNEPLGILDAVAAVLALLFLALETVSDEYQWRYHQAKKKLLEEKGALSALPEPYDLGFNTFGPWGRMRHPNYLGEQGIWMSLYIFVIAAGEANGGIFHWTMAGPLLLVFLFMGSSALGERISSKKYPLYGDYIEKVYKYIPLRRYRREREPRK